LKLSLEKESSLDQEARPAYARESLRFSPLNVIKISRTGISTPRLSLSLSLSIIDLPDGVFQGTLRVANRQSARSLERTISEAFVKRGRASLRLAKSKLDIPRRSCERLQKDAPR